MRWLLLLPGLLAIAAVRAPAAPEPESAQAKQYASCLRAWIGQDYLPQPAIWKLADGDTTIFLFGTGHLLPKPLDWRSDDLERIIDRAAMLVVESDPAADAAEVKTVAQRPPLVERVSGARRERLIGLLAGLPIDEVARANAMDGLAASVFLSGKVRRKPDLLLSPWAGADTVLRDEFRRAGKPIRAIETPQSVDLIIAEVDAKHGTAILESFIDGLEVIPSRDAAMKRYHDWATGRFDLTGFGGDAAVARGLNEQLLARRNRVWIVEIGRMLRRPGTALVAVGAGHLSGPSSLLLDLNQAGMRVERVSRTGEPLKRSDLVPTPARVTDCERYIFGAR